MRLLFAAVGAYGHLYPVVPVALAAQEAGHEVVVATHGQFHPTLKEAGLSAVAAGLTVEEAFGAVMAGLEGPPENEGVVAVEAFARLIPERTIADLRPLLADGEFDLVIHEIGNPGAGVAARVAGVPAALMALGRLPDGPLWDVMFPALGELAAAHGVPVRDPRTLDHPYLDMCPPSFQASGFAESVETHIVMRPRAWNPPGALPRAALERDSKRPLVYLTLGTTGAFAQPDVLRQMIEGLSHLPADAIMSSGPAVPSETLGALPDNVTVLEWVPQADLLAHVDVAVHHGGSGSMFAAMAQGVPQLLLPQGADQFANAEMLSATGAARQILPADLTPSRVAEGVRTLLDDEQARTSARRLQAEIAAMPSIGQALDRVTTWAQSSQG